MKTILIYIFLISSILNLYAQNVTINPSGITPAMTGVYPRLTYSQILALPNPQAGDLVYDVTNQAFRYYNSSKWIFTFQKPNESTPVVQWCTSSENNSGSDEVIVKGLSLDVNGNILMTGYFQGYLRFGGIKINASFQLRNLFIVKFTSNGKIEWLKTAEATSNAMGDYSESNAIACDNTGNVYITGSFKGTANFSTSNILTSTNIDAYVAKYDSNGDLIWATKLGGSGDSIFYDIALDDTGNIYTTGKFSGTVQFMLFITQTSAGLNDCINMKFNNAGTYVWYKVSGSLGEDYGESITVNNTSVCITGQFFETITIGSQTLTSPQNSQSIFLSKYNTSGSFQWAKQVYVLGSANNGCGCTESGDVTFNANGDIFISGRLYPQTAYFDNITITYPDHSHGFLAKYNSSGQIQWVKMVLSDSFSLVQTIAIDTNNNIFVGGWVSNYFRDNIPSEYNGHNFIRKFDPDGNVIWGKTMGSSSYNLSGLAVSNGGIFVGGNFNNIGHFDSILKFSGNTNETAFVAKIIE